MILGVALAGGLVGAFATKSFSQGFGPAWSPWHMTVRGPMMARSAGQLTAEQMADRADRMVRHLAIEIDATAEQQAQARGDREGRRHATSLPMREKVLAARQQARELLDRSRRSTAPRSRSCAPSRSRTLDAVSKRVAQALGDAAEVLTPEQRRKLDDMLPPPASAARRPGGFWHGVASGVRLRR